MHSYSFCNIFGTQYPLSKINSLTLTVSTSILSNRLLSGVKTFRGYFHMGMTHNPFLPFLPSFSFLCCFILPIKQQLFLQRTLIMERDRKISIWFFRNSSWVTIPESNYFPFLWFEQGLIFLMTFPLLEDCVKFP